MGWINRIRNVFGMGDSQDPSRRPPSTHSRGSDAEAVRPRQRRKSSGGHGSQPPVKAAPTAQMTPEELRQGALAHHQQKHWEKALAFWRRLHAIGAEGGDDVLLGLVICLLNLNRPDEARPYFSAPDAPVDVRLEAAHYFLGLEDFAQALPLWRSLAAEKNTDETRAAAWRMRCLMELGLQAEARFLYDAPDARPEELIVAANFLQREAQWEAALKLWHRPPLKNGPEQADSQAGQVRCLLELDRADEARILYTAPSAPADAVLAAAEFHYDHDRYQEALPLFQQTFDKGPTQQASARRGQTLCLLQLDLDDEARRLLEQPDLPLEALRAAAIFYHDAERWEEALAVDRLIAKRSEEDRAAAEGFQVACLLNLGREAEARKLYEIHEARPQCRRAAADFLTEHERFGEALAQWEPLSELPDFRPLALKNRVYCLLHLNREAEAQQLYGGDKPELTAVLGAANYFFNRENHDRALPLWRQAADLDPNLRRPVAGKLVTCLLELSREAEARALYEPADAPAGALAAAAEYWMFPKEGAPGTPSDLRSADTHSEALGLWERLLAQSAEHRLLAERGRLACLLGLERFDEAMAQVRAPEAHHLLLLDATLFFCLSQRWPQALPLLDEVIASDSELRERSLAFKVAGLLTLERHAEAAALYDAADAADSTVLAAAEFFRERGQWDTALSLYRRIAGSLADGDRIGIGQQVDCLLWLGRDAEAQGLYAGAHAPRQAVISAGNFFVDTERWQEALPIWQRLDRTDVPFRGQVQAHIVGCLLRLDRRDEAQGLYRPGDAAPEVLFAAWSVLWFLNDWTETLALADSRLTDRRPAVAQAARTYRLRCLIRLGRLEEARPLFAAAGLSAELLGTVGRELMEAQRWTDALEVWRECGRRFPQKHRHAPAHEAYCLLALGRHEEARRIFEPADAAPGILAQAASFFDARRNYAAAASLHGRLIAAQPGANALLGYFKNRVAAGDWPALDGGLADRLFRELDPLCRRNDVNAYRQALWLPLIKGRFDEVLAKSLAIERRVGYGWRAVRCYELQLIAAALAGARKPFERAFQRYQDINDGLDDVVTVPDMVRAIAARHGVALDPAIDARLATLLQTD